MRFEAFTWLKLKPLTIIGTMFQLSASGRTSGSRFLTVR